ncbi:hypothetical protein Pmani_036308 [Petrolisthes manimaculis]|uniref:Uncharacterized protein n=1 Tax=Petrolisthes manimaculis TaxID=1843537 RepID=A0AAE1NKL2_9EUCA|nr:hypothetical protein Pmani_036308 [Petrolisthes manimaculis]
MTSHISTGLNLSLTTIARVHLYLMLHLTPLTTPLSSPRDEWNMIRIVTVTQYLLLQKLVGVMKLLQYMKLLTLPCLDSLT